MKQNEKKTTNPTLHDESWMAPRRAELREGASAEDKVLIRSIENYAFEHEMSWSEAVRYVV